MRGAELLCILLMVVGTAGGVVVTGLVSSSALYKGEKAGGPRFPTVGGLVTDKKMGSGGGKTLEYSIRHRGHPATITKLAKNGSRRGCALPLSTYSRAIAIIVIQCSAYKTYFLRMGSTTMDHLYPAIFPHYQQCIRSMGHGVTSPFLSLY
jgi:hypothetical protein